jgi:hypothetical protein
MSDACYQGVCDPLTGSCMRVTATEDGACGGEVDCGLFGEGGGFTEPCDSSGTRSGQCRRTVCQDDDCVSQDYVETAQCTRTTEGTPCDAETVTSCGSCGGFSDTCDGTGTQNCACTNFTCRSDACTPVTMTCSRPCSRDTDGVTCGPDTQTNCGACSYSNSCAESGSQTCTCSSFSCLDQFCIGASSPCIQPCSRDTDGNSCSCAVCGPNGEARPVCCSNGVCAANCGVCGGC